MLYDFIFLNPIEKKIIDGFFGGNVTSTLVRITGMAPSFLQLTSM